LVKKVCDHEWSSPEEVCSSSFLFGRGRGRGSRPERGKERKGKDYKFITMRGRGETRYQKRMDVINGKKKIEKGQVLYRKKGEKKRKERATSGRAPMTKKPRSANWEIYTTIHHQIHIEGKKEN